MSKLIRLSDHFTYGKLLRFTLPSICMMVFTSIYGVVDGLFVSNFVGKTPFAAVNLVMPFVMILGGMGFMIGTGGVTLTVLARVLAAPLSRLFVGYDASLYALTTHAFRLFCWSFLLAGFNIFASGFFTALNNGAVSAAISFLRTLVFQAGSVVILPVLLGVDGIWWAITAAEIFAFIISGVFLVLKRNKYHYM